MLTKSEEKNTHTHISRRTSKFFRQDSWAFENTLKIRKGRKIHRYVIYAHTSSLDVLGYHSSEKQAIGCMVF